MQKWYSISYNIHLTRKSSLAWLGYKLLNNYSSTIIIHLSGSVSTALRRKSIKGYCRVFLGICVSSFSYIHSHYSTSSGYKLKSKHNQGLNRHSTSDFQVKTSMFNARVNLLKNNPRRAHCPWTEWSRAGKHCSVALKLHVYHDYIKETRVAYIKTY